MTDLKPGQLMCHTDGSIGLIDDIGDVCYFEDGSYCSDSDLTGWTPAEILKPGRVQVRVDDLNEQPHALLAVDLRARAAWLAWAEQQKTAQPETVGDGCECWVTPERMWTTHYGAVEPGSQVEYNPHCPKHGESKPATTTVELPCPCGKPLTGEVFIRTVNDDRWLSVRGGTHDKCARQPAQPDEPTAFGAQVTVTLPNGEVEKWLRGDDGSEPWISENTLWWSWEDLCERGVVTLGWGEQA